MHQQTSAIATHWLGFESLPKTINELSSYCRRLCVEGDELTKQSRSISALDPRSLLAEQDSRTKRELAEHFRIVVIHLEELRERLGPPPQLRDEHRGAGIRRG